MFVTHKLTVLDRFCHYYQVDDCAFFWRRAPEKILKLRRVAVANGDMSQNFELDDHRNSRWGLDYFTHEIRVLALKCGFEEADRFTMRSLRRTGLTNMAIDDKLASSVVTISGRHKSTNTSALYQQQNEAALVQRAKAVQFNPNRGNVPKPPGNDVDDSSKVSDKKKSRDKKKKKSKKISRLDSDDSSDDSSDSDDESSDDDSHKKRRRKKKKKKKTCTQDPMMAFMMQQQLQQLQQFQMMNPFSAMMNSSFGGMPSASFGTTMPGTMVPAGAKFNPFTGERISQPSVVPPVAKFDPVTGKRLIKPKQPAKKSSLIIQLDSPSSDDETSTQEQLSQESQPSNQQMSQELVVYSPANRPTAHGGNQTNEDNSDSDESTESEPDYSKPGAVLHPNFDFEKHSQAVLEADLRGEGPQRVIVQGRPHPNRRRQQKKEW